ncbi:nucleotide exchange factor GrpE [bacterium]|nr:nucleotide exchange factor GrpE [bacterium]
MTEKDDNGRRKIEIEDKRARDDEAAGASQRELDEQLMQLVDSTIEDEEPAQAAVEPGPGQPPVGDPIWVERAGEYLELAQRKEAELRNYRKRVQKDMELARRYAVEGLLADLFPALDGLAQAVQSFQNTPDEQNPLLEGVRRTIKVLESAMGKHGIEKINAVNVPFNPERHNAINVEESGDVAVDTVAEVYVEGYCLGDTVLKPAIVRVLKPA